MLANRSQIGYPLFALFIFTFLFLLKSPFKRAEAEKLLSKIISSSLSSHVKRNKIQKPKSSAKKHKPTSNKAYLEKTGANKAFPSKSHSFFSKRKMPLNFRSNQDSVLSGLVKSGLSKLELTFWFDLSCSWCLVFHLIF